MKYIQRWIGWSGMTQENNTFCPMPWNSINLRNNGDIRICCNANSYSKRKGIMRKDDGTPYNAGRDDWDEARNCALIKEVRADMLKGKWNPDCERCRQEEVNGIVSRREYEGKDWKIDLETAKKITKGDGTLDTSKQAIEFFDIRYGNFCNLKCRMCGPTDSHMWYGDFVKLNNTTKYKDTHDIIELYKKPNGKYTTDQYDWFKDADHYWDQFEKHTKGALKLYIVGGEPLIIDEHEESLNRLVKSGKAKNIQIEYNTNLTNVSDKMLELWENFKQIRIGVSIDGTGDVFEYQRPPANWDKVYNNMKKLNDNMNINLKCWFAFTVTPYNIFHLPEFMKWHLDESGLTRFNPKDGPRPTVTHHMCHSPKYFNVKCLPELIKSEIEDQYEFYKEWVNQSEYSDHVKNHYNKVLDGVIKFMKSEDNGALEEFIDVTNKLDKMRGQNILDVVPEYEELFNGR